MIWSSRVGTTAKRRTLAVAQRMVESHAAIRRLAERVANYVQDPNARPLVSIVVPPSSTPRCLAALSRQNYSHVERVNAAADASGEYLTWLPPSRPLPQHALWQAVRAIGRDRTGEVAGVFSGGDSSAPIDWLRPERSSLGLLGFVVIRTAIARKLGIASMQPGAQMWTRVLRCGYRLNSFDVFIRSEGDAIDCGADDLESAASLPSPPTGVPFLFDEPSLHYRQLLSSTQAALRDGDDEAAAKLPRKAWLLFAREHELSPTIERKLFGLMRSSSQGVVDVLFMPHNAYHAREMAAVAAHLEARSVSFAFVNIDAVHENEGVGAALHELGLRSIDYHPRVMLQHAPRLLFVMNDWGGVVADEIARARRSGVRSCALVEGAQDFADDLTAGARRRPYRHADQVLLIGNADRRYLTGVNTRVVGSPRLEALTRETAVLPDEPLVVVNCNFTYGVQAAAGNAWLRSAIEACQRAGLPFVISRHPADNTDLRGHPNMPLGQALRRGTVLVSRFSTAILEALALGRPVIYHNPHREPVGCFADAVGHLSITDSTAALATALSGSTQQPQASLRRASGFFERHLALEISQTAEERIAEAIGSQLAQIAARRPIRAHTEAGKT